MIIKADDLWTAIDQIATEHGWTTSALARRAGLDATAFNRSKRQFKGRDRWPASSSVAKVLEVTGESFLEFATRVAAAQAAREPSEAKRSKSASRDNAVRRRQGDQARRAAQGGP